MSVAFRRLIQLVEDATQGGTWAPAGPAYETVKTRTLPDGRTIGKYTLGKTGETLFIETVPNWEHDADRFPDYDGEVLLVRAVMDGRTIGSATFYYQDGDRSGSVEDVRVAADQRRKGVATVMYDHLEHVVGLRPVPTDGRMEPDGRAFWRHRQGRGLTESDEPSGPVVTLEDEPRVEHKFGQDLTYYAFRISHPKLPKPALVTMEYWPEFKRATVNAYGSMENVNALGPAAMRQIVRQIKAHIPDLEALQGPRVSGARATKPKFRDRFQRLDVSKIEVP